MPKKHEEVLLSEEYGPGKFNVIYKRHGTYTKLFYGYKKTIHFFFLYLLTALIVQNLTILVA